MRLKVSGEGSVGEIGDGAGHLDASRAAADDDEGQQRALALGIGLQLGGLEGEQDLAPNGRRVGEPLESRRVLRPLVVPEVAGAGPGRQNQKVVG